MAFGRLKILSIFMLALILGTPAFGGGDTDDYPKGKGNFTTEFTIQNKEKTPLIIYAAKPVNLKCTSKFPKVPVMPGKVATISVSCASVDFGPFREVIVVVSNQGKSNQVASGIRDMFVQDPTDDDLTGPIHSFTQRMAIMRSECFNRDWANTSCDKMPAKDEEGSGYGYGIGDRITWTIINVFDGESSNIKRLIDKYVTPPGSCGISMTAVLTRVQDVELSQLEHELADFASKNKLSQCKRACLATCASSRLIRYNINTNTEPEYQPAYILDKGEGICRHFANLAHELMGALGLSSHTTGGKYSENGKNPGGHSWVSVKIDDERYWMEPQSSECVFLKFRD